MVDGVPGPSNLNLTAEEKRVYGQLFRSADPDGFGAVSGDVAVTFFERTKLHGDTLGEIWAIADSENRGLLTPPGFSVVLRLIGHAQAGRAVTAELASQPGPLPRFDALNTSGPASPAPKPGPPPGPPPPTTAAVPSSGPVRTPAISPEKVNEYNSLFEKSGAENGMLSSSTAKQIFEKARLPVEVLSHIWFLADTQKRGALDATEFTVAMHLLASYKSGAMRGLPQTLPPGLYDAAARRTPTRSSTAQYPMSVAPVHSIPRQFTGSSTGRPQSPIARQQIATPLSAQSTGDGWVVNPQDKAKFDQIFASLDKSNRGYIAGEQAVQFFATARLPEETLAQIWDLADISSEGRLSMDEFAVAMYLIRQQRGARDGRGNLPTTLPPALIPPRLRRQEAPTSQLGVSAFQDPPVAKTRSAADDLFGLDVMSSAPLQAAQSTGGSMGGGPFQNPVPSPIPTSSPPPSTSFKPFIPSSTFGQSLSTQPTGVSSSPSQAQRAPTAASDDLLGDADPEISQTLTPETSELANLSNQVSSLVQQTQQVQGTRSTTEQQLAQGSLQKREFESRLSQLRALYEKEVADVKSLQEQLSAHRIDVQKLQQQSAMTEGSLQDLQSQQQQLSAALETELREKAALNEKIKAANNQLTELRPQVEKMKSDARQQKGLVAISKKQLATLDGEKDRLQEELDTATADLDAAKREADEQSRNAPPVSSIASPTSVASPAASTASATNPFFRRGNSISETSFSPPLPGSQETKAREDAFDSMFGPSSSFATPNVASPPPISFQNDSPIVSRQIPMITSSSTSPSSSVGPFSATIPAPPTSRQITSASLPFRMPLDRADSISSSVKVAPSASRLSPGDTPRAGTPVASASSVTSQNGESPSPMAGPFGGEETQASSTTNATDDSVNEQFGFPSTQPDVPGAFPQIDTPKGELPPAVKTAGSGLGSDAQEEPVSTGQKDQGADSELKSDKLDANFDQYFGGPAHSRSPSQKAADFDSAFADLNTPATNGTSSKASEFPPIREIEEDSDDSDDTPPGFDDDFNTSASKGKAPVTEATGTEFKATGLLQPRPHLGTIPSTASSLPGISAQTSPPTYGESVPTDNPDHFPPEFKGLLPRRADPTSPPDEGPVSTDEATGAPVSRSVSQSYGPEVAKSPPGAAASSTPQKPTNFVGNDFDAAFAGMQAAPETEDDDDDTDTNVQNNHGSEFDPTFDSPAPNKTTASSILPGTQNSTQAGPTTESPDSKDMSATSAFYNFSSSVNDQQKPTGSTNQPASSGNAFKDSDWDNVFAGFDKTAADGNKSTVLDQSFPLPPSGSPTKANDAPGPSDQTMSPPPPPKETSRSDRPTPARAISMGTDHDDPILKRLTAMGWSRDDSLRALEKFDYNIDKAAEYLTFKM